MNTVEITPPSWTTALLMYATVVRDGTERGKRIATEEIVDAGRLLDALLADRKAGCPVCGTPPQELRHD